MKCLPMWSKSRKNKSKIYRFSNGAFDMLAILALVPMIISWQHARCWPGPLWSPYFVQCCLSSVRHPINYVYMRSVHHLLVHIRSYYQIKHTCKHAMHGRRHSRSQIGAIVLCFYSCLLFYSKFTHFFLSLSLALCILLCRHGQVLSSAILYALILSMGAITEIIFVCFHCFFLLFKYTILVYYCFTFGCRVFLALFAIFFLVILFNARTQTEKMECWIRLHKRHTRISSERNQQKQQLKFRIRNFAIIARRWDVLDELWETTMKVFSPQFDVFFCLLLRSRYFTMNSFFSLANFRKLYSQ